VVLFLSWVSVLPVCPCFIVTGNLSMPLFEGAAIRQGLAHNGHLMASSFDKTFSIPII
jgi:hypothetical protein